MLKKIVTIFFASISLLQAEKPFNPENTKHPQMKTFTPQAVSQSHEDSPQMSITKYRNPVQIVVFPFRVKNGEVEYLLMHRTAKRDGFWQGVSGGVEEGESLDLAAARELKEETGFEASVQSINSQFEYSVKERFRHIYSPNVKVIREHSFTADVTGLGEPTLSDEHDDFKWVPFDEIDIESLQWEGSRIAIRKAHEFIIKHLKIEENVS